MVFWRRLRRRRRSDKEVLLEAITTVRSALISVKRGIGLLESREDPPEAMLKSLYMLEYVLEAVLVRLETMLVIGLARQSLLIEPLELVREASRRLGSLPPEIHGYLEEVEWMLASLQKPPAIEAGQEDYLTGAKASGKVKEILEEAEKAALDKLAKKIGSSTGGGES